MPELLGYLMLGLVVLGVALIRFQRLIATGLLCVAALLGFTAWIDVSVVSLSGVHVLLAALLGLVLGQGLRVMVAGLGVGSEQVRQVEPERDSGVPDWSRRVAGAIFVALGVSVMLEGDAPGLVVAVVASGLAITVLRGTERWWLVLVPLAGLVGLFLR